MQGEWSWSFITIMSPKTNSLGVEGRRNVSVNYINWEMIGYVLKYYIYIFDLQYYLLIS